MLAVDVAVVGAGPAGVAAAIHLARAGRDVLLLDRARFPRDKACGDGLTAAALRELDDLGLAPGLLPTWQPVQDVWLRSPLGRTACFPLPRGPGTFAAVVPRLELDAALVDLARAAGVKVADGHCVTAAAEGHDRITLEAHGLGPVAARYAVGADGAWSPLRRLLGASGAGDAGTLGEWHAFRQYFRGVAQPPHELWVWFEPDIVPGYVWSFPLPGGRTNVGFGIQRGGPIRTREMKALWPELLARPQIRAVLGERAEAEATHRAWPIPARVDRQPLAAGRALFVGDAAAACDPMTGEGIGQALLTSRLAVRAMLAAGPLDPPGAGDRYRRAVERELVPDVRMSELLIRALRHRRGVDWALGLAALTPWTRRNFARWLFEDYPRGFARTPRRWPEHSLAGPGAWA